jgi:hypothetical protein
MDKVIADALKPQPLYYEARAYCDRHGIESADEMERVRLSMCAREFKARMQPWNDVLVKAHPAMYSVNVNEPLPQSYLDLQEQVREIARRVAKDLGLELPV